MTFPHIAAHFVSRTRCFIVRNNCEYKPICAAYGNQPRSFNEQFLKKATTIKIKNFTCYDFLRKFLHACHFNAFQKQKHFFDLS